MPTYDYQCSACGHRFEKFQSITAAPIRKCPKCGKSKLKRLIGTGAGLIFKGSGFYITDYRDASYKDKAKADNGAASSTDAGNNTDGAVKKADESSSNTASSNKPATKSEAQSSKPTNPTKRSKK